jgi:hypothetical protein
MQTAICWVIAMMLATGVTVGQQKSDSRVKVLTVCEILGDMKRYTDSAMTVVGRMERSVSLIDHYEFLSQDRCEHPVITHGHVWLDKIQTWRAWAAASPGATERQAEIQRQLFAKEEVLRSQSAAGSAPQGKPGGPDQPRPKRSFGSSVPRFGSTESLA